MENQYRNKIEAQLSGGKAFTGKELSEMIHCSFGDIQQILKSLEQKEIIRKRISGGRSYFYLTSDSYQTNPEPLSKRSASGVRYCRHCYGHLAGYVGVKLTEALVQNGLLIPKGTENYSITDKGWNWLNKMAIFRTDFRKEEKRIALQCLDFSERKSHLSGKIGSSLLQKMKNKHWFMPGDNSREIQITDLGKTQLRNQIGLIL